jgi:hypothetical protein
VRAHRNQDGLAGPSPESCWDGRHVVSVGTVPSIALPSLRAAVSLRFLPRRELDFAAPALRCHRRADPATRLWATEDMDRLVNRADDRAGDSIESGRSAEPPRCPTGAWSVCRALVPDRRTTISMFAQRRQLPGMGTVLLPRRIRGILREVPRTLLGAVADHAPSRNSRQERGFCPAERGRIKAKGGHPSRHQLPPGGDPAERLLPRRQA